MGFDGEKLKMARVEAHISVQEISDILEAKGIRAKKNTIYSWENGNSQPTPDALLTMCEKYHISDPLVYFGYINDDINTLSPQEMKIALAYRRATPEIKTIVNSALNPYMENEREKSEIAIG